MNNVQLQCWERGQGRNTFQVRVRAVEDSVNAVSWRAIDKSGGKYPRVRAGCKICINTEPEFVFS